MSQSRRLLRPRQDCVLSQCWRGVDRLYTVSGPSGVLWKLCSRNYGQTLRGLRSQPRIRPFLVRVSSRISEEANPGFVLSWFALVAESPKNSTSDWRGECKAWCTILRLLARLYNSSLPAKSNCYSEFSF
jgi:hypothetical protein